MVGRVSEEEAKGNPNISQGLTCKMLILRAPYPLMKHSQNHGWCLNLT